MTFLLDTSAWVLGGRNRAVAERRGMAMRSGDLGVSTVTAWDVLYSSRDVEEYEATLDRLRRLPWYDLSDPRAAVAV